MFEVNQFAGVVYSNWETTLISSFCLFFTHVSSLLTVALPVP